MCAIIPIHTLYILIYNFYDFTFHCYVLEHTKKLYYRFLIRYYLNIKHIWFLIKVWKAQHYYWYYFIIIMDINTKLWQNCSQYIQRTLKRYQKHTNTLNKMSHYEGEQFHNMHKSSPPNNKGFIWLFFARVAFIVWQFYCCCCCCFYWHLCNVRHTWCNVQR